MPARTLRFDRQFPGIGRIHRASGTMKKSVFADMNSMLTTLYGSGRLDVLASLRDCKLEPMVIFAAYRRGRLEELPTAEAMQPLAEAIGKWRATIACSRWHLMNIKVAEKRLLAGLSNTATITDLPPRLFALRPVMALKARSFNITRAVVLAFLRDTLGKASPLYRTVQGIPSLPIRNKVPHRPQMPRALAALTLDDATKACALALAASGMNPKEYWEDGWERRDGFIIVRGQKRAGRQRKVPDIGLVIAPPMTRGAFRQRLQKSDAPFTPIDLRRTFANWLEAAGIPRTRRKLYMGHGATDVTGLYEQHEVAEFLAQDGIRLKTWYEAQMHGEDPHSVPHLHLVERSA